MRNVDFILKKTPVDKVETKQLLCNIFPGYRFYVLRRMYMIHKLLQILILKVNSQSDVELSLITIFSLLAKVQFSQEDSWSEEGWDDNIEDDDWDDEDDEEDEEDWDDEDDWEDDSDWDLEDDDDWDDEWDEDDGIDMEDYEEWN